MKDRHDYGIVPESGHAPRPVFQEEQLTASSALPSGGGIA